MAPQRKPRAYVTKPQTPARAVPPANGTTANGTTGNGATGNGATALQPAIENHVELAAAENHLEPPPALNGKLVTAIAETEATTAPVRELPRPGRRRLFPAWFRRRWWVLALCLLAGLSGGVMARSSAKVDYSASAELIVESGAGPLGPGSANDANALALSDASIIPSDEATLNLVATETRSPLSEVSKSVTAVAISGTSVIEVSYKAKTASSAIADVNAEAQALSNGTPGAAIPDGSLVVVQLASSATRVGLVHSDGIPLGVILGLFVGAIALLTIERADPRIDDVEDLARVTGATASAFPGPLPMVELAWNIALASEGAPDVTVVPLTGTEEAQAEVLWSYLTMGVNQPTMVLNFVAASNATSSLLAEGSGPTVLVVKRNTRSRVVQGSVLRLQTLGRGPVWAVLAVGRLRPEKAAAKTPITKTPAAKPPIPRTPVSKTPVSKTAT
jgi:capsular polysaccharide biosynthesis protein